MANEKEFEDFVFKIALENAITYNGKANPKALLGKIIPQFPEIKKDIQFYTNKIKNIVQQVNDFTIKEQKEKLLKINPNYHKEKQTKKEKHKRDLLQLPELPNVQTPIVTRFEPSPTGHLHIGHLFGIIFNSEYARKYDGKLIVRFSDTNPETTDKDSYQNIKDNILWLTQNNVSEIYYQSQRLDLYYKYLSQLLQTGDAYICECQNETFREYNIHQKPCPHRNRTPEENLKLFNEMRNGKIQQGTMVIRFKSNLNNKNPALRDFSIARINTKEHPLVGTKYKLWPMMNLTVAIDDYDMKINYVIRGKDHEINKERQKMILSALGLKYPNYFHFGIIKFIDLELSKRKLLEKIKNKEYEGWDDPRLPTIDSLRKRGYTPKGITNTILASGISKRDSKITEADFFKKLNYHNKQILEKSSNRYFFVSNPKLLKIEGIEKYPGKKIFIPLHPDKKDRGFREFKVTNQYLIDRIDYDNINVGDTIRLMHFANLKILKKEKNILHTEYHSKEYDPKLSIKRNIHYVPTDQNENREAIIIMPNNEKVKGYTERLNNIKISTHLQFERFGFTRYDSTDKKDRRIFYFTHL